MDSVMEALPDLTACDREPITRLEAIQGFGFLIALSKDWTVERASANLAEMLDVGVVDPIGLPLDSLIEKDAVHDIRNRVLVLRAHRSTERLYGIRLRGSRDLFDLALHYAGDLLIVEGEPSGSNEGPEAAALVRTMVARLSTMKTLQAFHQDCARQVRAITGFNRVMVYRFEADGTGEVIAESTAGAMQSFRGLRYPASDIPVQARALYLRNPFRIIADVHADVVPLLPSSPSPLDLSLAVTRAVSPVHMEYLRNMGVAASLSISIIVEGRLWGLIACHNDLAGVPAFSRRSASELFVQMYAMMLDTRLRRNDAEREVTARREVDRMVGAIANDRRLLHDAAWLHGRLREMIACDGVAVVSQDALSKSGHVPPDDALAALATSFAGQTIEDIFVTERLAERYPAAFAIDASIAGLLAIPASQTAGHALLLFRRERIEQITWAGDQEAESAKNASAVRISPRRSFEAHAQARRGHSEEFTLDDRRTAEMVRSALVEIVARMQGETTREETRRADRQELLIAELNHRVRNILALIRGLINRSVTSGNDVATYVETLGGRVQALARAHDEVTRHNWGPGLLATLFEHEIAHSVSAQVERFQVVGPTVWLLPEAFSTMALVIHELVTNSLKHGALSTTGRVEVTVTRRVGDGLQLAWRDIDGPLVVAPTRRGFGSAIIERTVPFELQGTVDVRYAPHGIEVDLFVPEHFVWLDEAPSVEPTARDLSTPRSATRRPLEGLTLLLLEDNLIVALETEDLLRDLGAAAVHSASTVVAAFALLDRTAIDFAVLDVNVGSETSFGFARICTDRRIPFVFASGYGDNVDVGEQHRSVPIVGKPFVASDVARAVARVLTPNADSDA